MKGFNQIFWNQSGIRVFCQGFAGELKLGDLKDIEGDFSISRALSLVRPLLPLLFPLNLSTPAPVPLLSIVLPDLGEIENFREDLISSEY